MTVAKKIKNQAGVQNPNGTVRENIPSQPAEKVVPQDGFAIAGAGVERINFKDQIIKGRRDIFSSLPTDRPAKIFIVAGGVKDEEKQLLLARLADIVEKIQKKTGYSPKIAIMSSQTTNGKAEYVLANENGKAVLVDGVLKKDLSGERPDLSRIPRQESMKPDAVVIVGGKTPALEKLVLMGVPALGIIEDENPNHSLGWHLMNYDGDGNISWIKTIENLSTLLSAHGDLDALRKNADPNRRFLTVAAAHVLEPKVGVRDILSGLHKNARASVDPNEYAAGHLLPNMDCMDKFGARWPIIKSGWANMIPMAELAEKEGDSQAARVFVRSVLLGFTPREGRLSNGEVEKYSKEKPAPVDNLLKYSGLDEKTLAVNVIGGRKLAEAFITNGEAINGRGIEKAILAQTPEVKAQIAKLIEEELIKDPFSGAVYYILFSYVDDVKNSEKLKAMVIRNVCNAFEAGMDGQSAKFALRALGLMMKSDLFDQDKKMLLIKSALFSKVRSKGGAGGKFLAETNSSEVSAAIENVGLEKKRELFCLALALIEKGRRARDIYPLLFAVTDSMDDVERRDFYDKTFSHKRYAATNKKIRQIVDAEHELSEMSMDFRSYFSARYSSEVASDYFQAAFERFLKKHPLYRKGALISIFAKANSMLDEEYKFKEQANYAGSLVINPVNSSTRVSVLGLNFNKRGGFYDDDDINESKAVRLAATKLLELNYSLEAYVGLFDEMMSTLPSVGQTVTHMISFASANPDAWVALHDSFSTHYPKEYVEYFCQIDHMHIIDGVALRRILDILGPDVMVEDIEVHAKLLAYFGRFIGGDKNTIYGETGEYMEKIIETHEKDVLMAMIAKDFPNSLNHVGQIIETAQANRKK